MVQKQFAAIGKTIDGVKTHYKNAVKKSGPLNKYEAEATHRAGREWGHLAAHGIELGGVLLLASGGGLFVMGLAGIAYLEAAHRSHIVSHRKRIGTKHVEGFARYGDLNKAYGTALEENHEYSSFRHYREGRKGGAYFARGFFGALVNRSVIPVILRDTPAALKDVARKIEYNLTPNDPFYRGRKRTDVGMFGLPKKKKDDKPGPK